MISWESSCKPISQEGIDVPDCVAACPSFLAGKLNEKNPVETYSFSYLR